MDGKVYCLDAADGALIWSYQTLNRAESGNGKILASPAVYQGRVYIGNESSRFYCLNGETTNQNGDLKWSYDLPPASGYNDRTGLSSVSIGVMHGGEVKAYVGSDNGWVYCLSTADSPQNRKIWEHNAEACVESSPTVYAGTVYVGTSWYQGRDLVALDAANGDLLWYQELEEEARATAAAADAHLYIGVDTGHRFHKLNWSTGQWVSLLDLPANQYFVGSAALCSANLAFVGNDNGNVYALQQSDLSSPLSTYGSSGIVCSSPAISYAAESGARWVYVVTRANGGRLLAFRRQQ